MRAGIAASGLHIPPPPIPLVATNSHENAQTAYIRDVDFGEAAEGREALVVLCNRFTQLAHYTGAVSIEGIVEFETDVTVSTSYMPKVSIWRAPLPADLTFADIRIGYRDNGGGTAYSGDIAIYVSPSPLSLLSSGSGGTAVMDTTAPGGFFLAGAARGRLGLGRIDTFTVPRLDFEGSYHLIGHGLTDGSPASVEATGDTVSTAAAAYSFT